MSQRPDPDDLQRLALALDSAGIGSWELDPGTRTFRGDARLLALYGFSPDSDETRYDEFVRRVPAAHRGRVEQSLARAVAEHTDYAEEHPVHRPDGSWRWVATYGRPIYAGDGSLERVVGAAYDVTARREAADRAATTGRLLALVASASEALASSLETDEVVRNLTRLVVPTLADWSIVSLAEDGRLRDVAWWHGEPDRRETLTRLAEHRLEGREESAGSLQAYRSREPFLANQDVEAFALSVLRSQVAKDAIVELGLGSVAVFPLITESDEVLGMLTLARDRDRPGFSGEEVAAATDLCRRVATSLDHARRFGREREMSEQLQRSMLTDPVPPAHVEVVARYLPAAKAAQVGGDWYDAFGQVDGCTVLVVGDVVGHDSVAAAVMGQLRSMLRGIAVTSGAGPARLLADLDAALETLRMPTYATVVVASVDVPDATGDVTLRWSSAGHPPPLLVGPDGAVQVLAEHDLLLGVDPGLARSESVQTVPAGATLLLYTDGLVERREEDIDVGIERLRGLLAGVAATPLPQAVDELVATLVPASPDDDVVVLAVRVSG